MRRHTLLPAGLAAMAAMALILGLSACSGTADQAVESPKASSTATTQGSDPSLGPLDDYIGVGAGVTVSSDDAENREYEEAIARCMAAEGFEYVPFVPNIDSTVLPDGTVTLQPKEDSFPTLPPAEFAAQFGYGISTKPAASQQEEKDPNDAIIAKMSVAERVAYHQALYGKGNALDAQGYLAGNGLSSSDTSCSGRADAGGTTVEEKASVDKRVKNVQDSFKSLLTRIRALRDDEMADPRIATATRAWSTCMSAAGHPRFTELNQPRARARDNARKLLGQDLARVADADPSRLAALRQAEVDLAVADETCLGDWREAFATVKHDLEEQFVRDNIAELKDFRSAMAAAVADQDR